MKIEYNNQYLKTKEKIKNWIQNNENLKEKKETKCKNLIVDVGGTLQTLSYKTLIKYPNSVLGALFNNHVKIPKRKGMFQGFKNSYIIVTLQGHILIFDEDKEKNEDITKIIKLKLPNWKKNYLKKMKQLPN